MKKSLVSFAPLLMLLALLSAPARAQVTLGGHVVVPSTSDSNSGSANIVFTADANCTLATATNCTLSESDGAYVGTLNVTASTTLTVTRSLIVVLSRGRTYNVTNGTTQTLNVGGATGQTVAVLAGASASIWSPDGVNYVVATGASGGANFPSTPGLVFNTSPTASRNALSTDVTTLLGASTYDPFGAAAAVQAASLPAAGGTMLGSLLGYNVNNTTFVDGFTPALFPGINVAQLAWSSGATYPACQAVSYSGSNYLKVTFAVNATTVPGTDSTTWWQVQNANTPTNVDCAFYWEAAYAVANASNRALVFANTPSYGNPYQTNICMAEPTGQYQVSLLGLVRGVNRGPTEIKAGCSGFWMVSSPNQTGSLPYNLTIKDLAFDGNQIALGGLNMAGLKEALFQNLYVTGWNPGIIYSEPFVIGGGGTETPGYEVTIDNILIQGSGNNEPAGVAVSVSGGVPTATVSTGAGNSYLNAPYTVYVWGYGAGTAPCTTMGTATPTYTGTSAPYTLTGVTFAGYAGCSAPMFAFVPDIGHEFYGADINQLTDSTFRNIRVANAGSRYGIFFNADCSSYDQQSHPYGEMPILILSNCSMVHEATEIDTPVEVGIVDNSTTSTWANTQFVAGGGAAQTPGVVGFWFANGGNNLIQSTCETLGSGNAFYTVVGPTGPYADSTAWGTTNATNVQNCQTGVHDNWTPNPMLSPMMVSVDALGLGDSTVTAASTIALASPVVMVNGTSTISTITPYSGCTNYDCTAILIANTSTGPFTLGTGGNISIPSTITPTAGLAVIATYRPSTGLWSVISGGAGGSGSCSGCASSIATANGFQGTIASGVATINVDSTHGLVLLNGNASTCPNNAGGVTSCGPASGGFPTTSTEAALTSAPASGSATAGLVPGGLLQVLSGDTGNPASSTVLNLPYATNMFLTGFNLSTGLLTRSYISSIQLSDFLGLMRGPYTVSTLPMTSPYTGTSAIVTDCESATACVVGSGGFTNLVHFNGSAWSVLASLSGGSGGATGAAAITSGTINGAVIGGSTPAAGSFTTVTASTPIAPASGGTGSATVPAAGQILVGNAGATAYAPQTMSGDCTITSAAATTCTKTNGVAFGTAATTAATAYDAAGAAATALSSAEAYSANASNLSSGTVPAAQLPAFTGDATSTAGTSALTLGTVNSAPGTVGSVSVTAGTAPIIPSITVTGKGLVTAATATTLGNAASYSTGTSGSNVPLLSGQNVWSLYQTAPSYVFNGGSCPSVTGYAGVLCQVGLTMVFESIGNTSTTYGGVQFTSQTSTGAQFTLFGCVYSTKLCTFNDNITTPIATVTEIVSNGTVPTIAAGAAAGTSPTIAIAGNALTGRITLTVGTSPTTGVLFTGTFATAYTTAPFGCSLTPQNANASTVTASVYGGVPTTTAFTGNATTALTAGSQYIWQYGPCI